MKNLDKYLKVSLFFILALIMNSSCEKNDPRTTEDDPLVREEDTLYSPEVRFDITGRMLEGKYISIIEPDCKGNTWVASGKDLYCINDSAEKTYTLDYPILDISVAGDETLWIGTQDGGLGHLTQNGITWYTKANSGLPRDYINNVEAGSDGRVWFSSCAHNLGGLVVYDGKNFDLFTPDNSMLNQHIIVDIEIDDNGSLYVIAAGTVGHTNVYRISDDSWECLGNENGTFYWAWAFTVGPAGIIYLIEDFSLSSSSMYSDHLFEFRNNTWNGLEADFISSRYNLCTVIKADRRNYCWVSIIENGSYVLHVYNGTSWEEPPEPLFTGDQITTIETDMENNIYIGTVHNGVFILEQ